MNITSKKLIKSNSSLTDKVSLSQVSRKHSLLATSRQSASPHHPPHHPDLNNDAPSKFTTPSFAAERCRTKAGQSRHLVHLAGRLLYAQPLPYHLQQGHPQYVQVWLPLDPYRYPHPLLGSRRLYHGTDGILHTSYLGRAREHGYAHVLVPLHHEHRYQQRVTVSFLFCPAVVVLSLSLSPTFAPFISLECLCAVLCGLVYLLWSVNYMETESQQQNWPKLNKQADTDASLQRTLDWTTQPWNQIHHQTNTDQQTNTQPTIAATVSSTLAKKHKNKRTRKMGGIKMAPRRRCP